MGYEKASPKNSSLESDYYWGLGFRWLKWLNNWHRLWTTKETIRLNE